MSAVMKSAACVALMSVVSAIRMGPFPSSCIDQEDGFQWMKLLSNGHLHNDYPLIYQKCDQEYMIIDPHEDPNVMEYVTDSDEVVSWEDWWTPNTDWKESTWAGDEDDYFYYAISEDCSTCDLTQGHQTAFFVFTSFDCKHTAKGMRLFSALTRDGVKPAVGNDGTHCVCVKPADSWHYKTLDETSFHYDDAVEERDSFLEDREEATSLIGKYHWNAAYTDCEAVDDDDDDGEEVMAVETVQTARTGLSLSRYLTPLILSLLTVIAGAVAVGVWCIAGTKRLKMASFDGDSAAHGSLTQSVYVPYH